ncbi:MAG: HIT family protein [Caldilineales bacterium]
MTDCIFCAIVDNRAPASVIYEDDLCIGFMDIAPVNPGHALIVPRLHAAGLADLPEELGMHLFRVAQRTTAAIRSTSITCEGVNIFLADGEAAFQDVFHVHLHVIPRFSGDQFEISADWSQQPARRELDALAAAISDVYEQLWQTGE